MTKLSKRELLEYSIQFTHFEKTLAQWPGMSETVSATLFGINIDAYRDIKAGFTARAHQAAQELLRDQDFAARVDRIPFAVGSKVVAVGSSATDDYQSWFEILRHIFDLRRPQAGIRFVNASVSGDTTAHLMIRFLSVVRERPDWVIFHINANDARRHGLSPSGLSPTWAEHVFWRRIEVSSMRRWSVFCCRQRGLTSQVLKVVFAGRGCCCGSIEGGGMNQGLLSTPI